jgi:hypothetical protein
VAAFPPTDLPPGDLRPIYSATRLPGGPWNRYRSVQWVNAHRVDGDFLLVRPSDGWLVERSGPLWAVLDPVNMAAGPQILTPDQFAAAYMLDV